MINPRTIWVMVKREVMAFALSPIVYLVLFFFLLMTAFSFTISVHALNEGPREFTVMELFFQNFFIWTAQLFIMPVLTMRSFSEEYRLGTFEGLMTAPVRDWEVVLAKFFGVMIFFCVLWAPTGLYQLVFRLVTTSEAPLSAGPSWCCYLIIFMTGALYASAGIMASSMTRNQIIAAVISTVSISLLFFVGLLNFFFNLPAGIRDAIQYISIFEHVEQFSKGLINTKAIAFYISTTFLFLFLTQKIIESKRWRA